MVKLIIDGQFEKGPEVFEGAMKALGEFQNLELIVTGPSKDYAAYDHFRLTHIDAPYLDKDLSLRGLYKAIHKNSTPIGSAFSQLHNADGIITHSDTRAMVICLGNYEGLVDCFGEEEKKRGLLAAEMPNMQDPTQLKIGLDVGFGGQDDLYDARFYVIAGIIGEALFEGITGRKPVMGLMGNATEVHKPGEAFKEAFRILKDKGYDIHFGEGYFEYESGFLDVGIENGFEGNKRIKTLEGFARQAKEHAKGKMTGIRGAVALGLLALGAIGGGVFGYGKRLQPKHFNGAYITGFEFADRTNQPILIKGHGSADADGLYNAVTKAYHAVQNGVPDRIHQNLMDAGMFSR